MKIIAIPYAGGNRFSFRELQPYLNPDFEFVTLELPGRSKRILEPLLEDMDTMVEDLFYQINQHLDSEYVLFGHSMGGMLGNLLIHKLNQMNLPLPVHFFVSGCSAPSKTHFRVLRHLLDDDTLKVELRKLGGLPDEILNNQDLMDFFLPIIRADMKAIETNIYTRQRKYDVPILAMAGTSENIDDDKLNSWAEETSADFETYRFVGNHFFYLQHLEAFCNLINHKIEETHDKLLVCSY